MQDLTICWMSDKINRANFSDERCQRRANRLSGKFFKERKICLSVSWKQVEEEIRLVGEITVLLFFSFSFSRATYSGTNQTWRLLSTTSSVRIDFYFAPKMTGIEMPGRTCRKSHLKNTHLGLAFQQTRYRFTCTSVTDSEIPDQGSLTQLSFHQRGPRPIDVFDLCWKNGRHKDHTDITNTASPLFATHGLCLLPSMVRISNYRACH